MPVVVPVVLALVWAVQGLLQGSVDLLVLQLDCPYLGVLQV